MVRILAVSFSRTKEATISLVNPRARRANATIQDPTMMMGRLLPNLDLDSSAMTPIMGCTINPDKGPATQTSDVCPLVSPRDRR